MARSIPRVQDDSLHVPTRDGDGISIITLGSAAWDSWVEHACSFRFESPHASFTARKEQRPGGWYWYAYRRRHGTLHIVYLGKSEELSIERLRTVAAVLERAEDSSAETSHQSRQPSFDAALQTPHTSIIPFPPALSVADSLPEATPVPKHNLPIQVTSLVGREPAIATATALLRSPGVRLLSMIGTGGIGKTRLAIEVAMELLEDFTDGLFFVALAPLRDPNMILPTIAHTLGLKESASELVSDRLHTYLRHKHLLLVLDNFEHLMPAAHVVGELLITCPNLKLLVTSREVLHLYAEQQFSVPPLALPGGKQIAKVESLTEYPALDLFLQRARTVKHDFQLDTTNAQALTEICTHLDGLPLAIELAAARIKFLSPQALLARLEHRLHVLTSGARDLPERQQTLRTTIAWSYELLNAEEQRLFRRLSIFLGGCSLEAIEAVCHVLGDGDGAGHIFERVTSLIDKSLLQTTGQEGEQPRLTMLETIREYGLECLATSGETEATRQAHALYYLQLAEEIEPQLYGAEQQRWFAWLERELDNLRAALNCLLERGERGESSEMALRLGTSLWYFWMTQSHAQEGWTFLERALERSEGIAPSLRAKALWIAGGQIGWLGDTDRGEALCKESLALFREIGDVAGVGTALFNLGEIEIWKSNLAAARSRFEERLAASKEVGDTRAMAWTLVFVAFVDNMQGEYTKGRSHAEASLLLLRELGDTWGIAHQLWVLAEGFLEEGDAAKAHPLLEESRALFRETGDKDYEGCVLGSLGLLAFQQGNMALAHSLIEEGLTHFQGKNELYNLDNKAFYLLARLAQVVAFEGDNATARELYDQCLAIARKSPNQLETPIYLEGLAAMVAAQGELTWAARLWGAAEALRESLGIPLPPIYRADYERSVTAARTQLGEQAFDAAWAEGRAMTLEQVLAARKPVPMPALTTSLATPPVEKSPSVYPDGLTAREVEVLRLVAQGLSNAEIAEQLIISLLTVKAHMRSLYNKLGISSRSAATRYAIEHHLL